MTIPVYVPGMHIDDNGVLVIHADKAAEAGVRKIELIEETPEAQAEQYSCGYSTVWGAFHKPGCTGGCGFMNPCDTVKQRRIQRRKANDKRR